MDAGIADAVVGVDSLSAGIVSVTSVVATLVGVAVTTSVNPSLAVGLAVRSSARDVDTAVTTVAMPGDAGNVPGCGTGAVASRACARAVPLSAGTSVGTRVVGSKSGNRSVASTSGLAKTSVVPLALAVAVNTTGTCPVALAITPEVACATVTTLVGEMPVTSVKALDSVAARMIAEVNVGTAVLTVGSRLSDRSAGDRFFPAFCLQPPKLACLFPGLSATTSV